MSEDDIPPCREEPTAARPRLKPKKPTVLTITAEFSEWLLIIEATKRRERGRFQSTGIRQMFEFTTRSGLGSNQGEKSEEVNQSPEQGTH